MILTHALYLVVNIKSLSYVNLKVKASVVIRVATFITDGQIWADSHYWSAAPVLLRAVCLWNATCHLPLATVSTMLKIPALRLNTYFINYSEKLLWPVLGVTQYK